MFHPRGGFRLRWGGSGAGGAPGGLAEGGGGGRGFGRRPTTDGRAPSGGVSFVRARRPGTRLKDADKWNAAAQQEVAVFLRLPGIELPLIPTASRALHKLAERGKYRQDLAYALSPLTIILPPLAKREGDLPLLTQFFLE